MKHPERLTVYHMPKKACWLVLLVMAVLLAVALIGRPIADALR